MAHLRVSADFLPHQCGSFSFSRKDSCFRNHTGNSCTYHRAGNFRRLRHLSRDILRQSRKLNTYSFSPAAGDSPASPTRDTLSLRRTCPSRDTRILSTLDTVPQRDMHDFVPLRDLSHSGTRPTLTSHTLSLRGTCPARDSVIF